MIFGQGFLLLVLDKSISNCPAAVLVLVRPGYFISPVLIVSVERSPMEKRRGMVFGFRKMATAVKKTGQIDR